MKFLFALLAVTAFGGRLLDERRRLTCDLGMEGHAWMVQLLHERTMAYDQIKDSLPVVAQLAFEYSLATLAGEAGKQGCSAASIAVCALVDTQGCKYGDLDDCEGLCNQIHINFQNIVAQYITALATDTCSDQGPNGACATALSGPNPYVACNMDDNDVKCCATCLERVQAFALTLGA